VTSAGVLDVAGGGLDLGAGTDAVTVSGTLLGSGNLTFGNGDDTLTLDDGANIAGFTGVFDGGAHSAGDTLLR
jgi:fibronectin-binding autotransporter adhesin